jgi:MTH538 TIR-like domain (DUF1863)
MLRNYKIFISHAWHRDEEYWRVVKMLNETPYFSWLNLSVPEHDPIDSNDTEELKRVLRDQIRESCVFIACCGMWVPRSEWILHEVQFARRIGRPVIGVPPWGQVVLPIAISPHAQAIASRQDTLISAIRSLALPEGS